MLVVYNTLSSKKEVFKPIKSRKVYMYTCGVTVYDRCHIGHGRSLYVFEVIRRYLSFLGFKVVMIRNITDIDDKIIAKANEVRREYRISIDEAVSRVTQENISAYYEDLKNIGIPRADFEPKATEHIQDMVEFIKGLVDKGFAYCINGSVYFRVNKFSQYGKLSGQNTEQMLSGIRVDISEGKEDPLDFALWKRAKEGEPSWDSPWGKGRPGWHIECSVMARFYAGDTIDIHGGGKDLVFPHHENEIAQSESFTGKNFSNYWMHHGLVTINRQKMSKSIGNFITLQEALDKYGGDVLKIFYLSATYHSPLDFTNKSIDEARRVFERLIILSDHLSKFCSGDVSNISNTNYIK